MIKIWSPFCVLQKKDGTLICLYKAIILAGYVFTQVKKVVSQVNNVINTEIFRGAERRFDQIRSQDKNGDECLIKGFRDIFRDNTSLPMKAKINYLPKEKIYSH